jgi:hypothetical protein
MKNLIKIFILLLIAVFTAHSVPLENWRQPFYQIAFEQNRISGSPSNMFWDDMLLADVMNSSLWPDISNYSKNHWTLEPALFETFSNATFVSGKKSNLHFDLLSNFRYGNFTVRTLLDVDQSNKKDPDYVWKKDRIAAGLIEEAYLQYTGKRGFIRLGRLKRNWGPFYDRSILLSNNPFAYDAFEWQFYTRFLEFRHLLSAFPRYYSYKDTKDSDKNNKLDRYFVAHTLNFIFGKWASLGVSETVIFSRDNGFPDFQYINPISIYSVINTNAEGQANLMLGFQGWVHPFTEKVTLKGQVVFDDFQVDDADTMDQEPMHWACDFGIYGIDLLPVPINHHFTLEYRYLSKWMYTVTTSNTFKGERYTYLGRSLGYQDIDGDYFKGAFTLVGKDFWAASIGMSVNRKDTGTVNTLWPSDTLGYTKETSLSKRSHLTTTLSNFIELHGYFRNFCTFHLNFENRWIKHKDEGDNYIYDPRITVGITAHYSNFFIKFKDE